MEINNSNATLNGPGRLVIKCAILFDDLPAFIRLIKDEVGRERSDRNSITVFRPGGMEIVLN